MSLVFMTATAEPAAVEQPASKARLARWARPALGLLLPVGSRSGWEIAVRVGLVERPPGAAAVGHLEHILRSCRDRRTAAARAGDLVARALAGFVFGVTAGTIARRDRRLFGADASPGRSDAAGPARDPVDRLGAAVHPLVRDLRGFQDHPDRGRRVLSGLSRRDGRGPFRRPQDRRGRPRLSPLRSRHGAAHPAAGGHAGICDLAARRARARLDVRGRGRIPRRLDRPRFSPDRRPAARQARSNRRRHRRLCHPGQD